MTSQSDDVFQTCESPRRDTCPCPTIYRNSQTHLHVHTLQTQIAHVQLPHRFLRNRAICRNGETRWKWSLENYVALLSGRCSAAVGPTCRKEFITRFSVNLWSLYVSCVSVMTVYFSAQNTKVRVHVVYTKPNDRGLVNPCFPQGVRMSVYIDA